MPLLSFEDLSKRVSQINDTAMVELERSSIESKYHKDSYIKLRTEINYLSFAIVGAILAFHEEIDFDYLTKSGCAILLINAIASYINVSRFHKTNYKNYDDFTLKLNEKRAAMMAAFNDFTKDADEKTGEDLQASFEKHHQAAKVLIDWAPEKHKDHKPGPLERFYFFLLVLGIALIGVGTTM
jgi:hypothetical protein